MKVTYYSTSYMPETELCEKINHMGTWVLVFTVVITNQYIQSTNIFLIKHGINKSSSNMQL